MIRRCPRCGTGPLRREPDGDRSCWCGYIEYATKPLPLIVNEGRRRAVEMVAQP